MASASSPRIRAPGFVRWKLGLAVVVIAVILALLLVMAVFPRPPTVPGLPSPVLGFGALSISGNQTSGWTFLVPAYLAAWVGPGQMPWGNVTFGLMNGTNGEPLTPYSIPAGTTLGVFAPAESVSAPYGSLVAEYNLSASSWQSGGSAAIQDGQWVVLQGMIPPGHYSVNGTSGTFTGPSLGIESTFGEGNWTMYMPLGV